MEIPDGYHAVPRGKLAGVQTYLQMTARPPLRPEPDAPSWRVERLGREHVRRYRALFHHVGDEYLWASRLVAPDEDLEALLTDARVELYALTIDGRDEGILELDFRVDGECELSLFGVATALLHTGAGRWLMNRGIEFAWARPIERFWLHTCTLDHPSALAFYKRTGFEPYERKVEVYDDPRYLGLTRADAAPHVPIL
jgi:GNAT superfamily N-acetyltransferase